MSRGSLNMPTRPRSRFTPALVIGTGLPLLLAAQSPAFAAKAQAPLRVVGLRTEYRENPLGIDARKPRLSWRIESLGRGVVQSAYEIRVARSERGLQSKGDRVWESGEVASDESIQRPYEGPALRSGERCYWQVRVWDGSGMPSAWSAPAWWEMGLLEPSDWKASWIEPGLQEDVTKSGPAPMLRREFELSGVVTRARAYVTSHGLYEMHLNGQRVGDQLFTPGWTSYNKRLQYQTYDVTALLKTGDNAVGVMLGNGWYRGEPPRGHRSTQRLRRSGRLAPADRDRLQGRTQAGRRDGRDLEGGDGPDPDVGDLSRRDVRRAPREARLDGGRVRRSRVVGGAGREPPPGRPRRAGRAAGAADRGAQAGQDPQDTGRRHGRGHGPEHGRLGAARRCRGPPGTTVTLRHAEMLDKDGNFYTENLRSGEGHGALHAEGRRAGDVRAALHLPRLPLRGGRRLPGRADARTR